MTYKPRQLDAPEAGQAAMTGDLLPWREVATLVDVKPSTLARWIDRGNLAYVTVNGRRYVDLTEAATVEADTRRAGKRQ